MKFRPDPKPEKKQKKPIMPLKRTALKKYAVKINRRSEKRALDEKAYNTLVKVWLVGKICPECGKPATEVHHKKGRIGKLLTDVRWWLGVTSDCHKKIELNPDWAKEKGYSLSRLSNEENKHTNG
jgi:hypothetical protein